MRTHRGLILALLIVNGWCIGVWVVRDLSANDHGRAFGTLFTLLSMLALSALTVAIHFAVVRTIDSARRSESEPRSAVWRSPFCITGVAVAILAASLVGAAFVPVIRTTDSNNAAWLALLSFLPALCGAIVAFILILMAILRNPAIPRYVLALMAIALSPLILYVLLYYVVFGLMDVGLKQ
jgi:hypothetical protein